MRPTLAREDFVKAGLEIVAESGLAGLTTRALGERLGTHATTLYRHVPNWDGLLIAVTDELVGNLQAAVAGALADLPTPRARLRAIATTFRGAILRDPQLARMFRTVLEADTVIPTPNIDRLTTLVISQLRELGLEGPELAIAHQSIESCTLGSAIVDFAGYPNHLTHRRLRRRMLGLRDYADVAAEDSAIAVVNERAFELTLEALLDAVEALAQRTQSSTRETP